MSKKKTYYFQHDCNAREDDKLIALRMDKGAAGYGTYFLLLEILSTAPDCMFERNYNKLGFILHIGSDEIKAVVEKYGLFQFTEDGKQFYSVRLKEHIEEMQEVSKERSKAGRKGCGNPNFKKGQPNPYYSDNNTKEDKQEDKQTFIPEINNKDKQMFMSDINKNELLFISDINSKDKIIKDNIITSSSLRSEDVSGGTPPDASSDADRVDYLKLVQYWNDVTHGQWGKLKSIDNNRRKMVRARIAKHGKLCFVEAIQKVAKSDFLADATWFNFDWFIRPNNFDKVISGNFDKRPQTNGNSNDTRTVTKPTGGYKTDF